MPEGPGQGSSPVDANPTSAPTPSDAAPVPEGPGRPARDTFSPAPRIPAPWRAARPSKRFVPVAGMIIEDKKEKKGLFGRRRKKEESEPEEDDGLRIVQDDQTPTWVYKLILLVAVPMAFWGFLYWNSSSEIIGPGWKTALLVEIVTLSIIALVVWVRLARKMSYGSRFAAWAQRRAERTMQSLRNAAYGVASAGKGIKSGGANFREGLAAKKEAGVVGKAVRKVVSFFARIVLGIIKLIVGIFRFVYRIYVLVDRLVWSVYRGIVEPVLFLAFRIVRWALKVVWRILRWALKVVWKVFYWLVRRWPIKYVTRLLEQPVRGYARHRVLLTNVVVSDTLGAPVRPQTREAAEPYLAVYTLHRETRRAARLVEKETRVEAERDLWLTIPTPEERRARAEERKRRKAEEKAAAKQAKIDEKQAQKEAKKRRKEEIKQAKAEGRDIKAEEKAAKKAKKRQKGDAEATEEAGPEETEAKIAAGVPAQQEAETGVEPQGEDAAAEGKGKKEKKEKKPKEKLSRAEKKRRKQQAKLEKKAEKVREKRRAKEEKKQAKLDKKAAKKDKKSKKGKAEETEEGSSDEAPQNE